MSMNVNCKVKSYLLDMQESDLTYRNSFHCVINTPATDGVLQDWDFNPITHIITVL